MGMSDVCFQCGEDLGYDTRLDDPPKDGGHIDVTWHPDEPQVAVSETRCYCSIGCLLDDSDELPDFAVQEDGGSR